MSKLIITGIQKDSLAEDVAVCALEENGRIVGLQLFRTENPFPLTGRIYIGQVEKIAGNIKAAFVRFGDGQTGYLSLDGGRSLISAGGQGGIFCSEDSLRPGMCILVQVIRESMKGKLPGLSGQLSLAGSYLVLLGPGQGLTVSGKLNTATKKKLAERMREILEAGAIKVPTSCGLILRTNAENASDEDLSSELQDLASRYERLIMDGPHRTCGSLLYTPLPEHLRLLRDVRRAELEEVVTDLPEIYEELRPYVPSGSRLTLYQDPLLPLSVLKRVPSVLEEILREKVWLSNGGFLVIQQTEAFVCIDVNTGKNLTGRVSSGSAQEAILQFNLAAAAEIACQIRLRNLSGIILIDFINMPDRSGQEILIKEFERLLRSDPAGCRVIDLTPLGIAEVTRRKTGPSLAEQIGTLRKNT